MRATRSAPLLWLGIAPTDDGVYPECKVLYTIEVDVPHLQNTLMQMLYGHDIWQNYTTSDRGIDLQGWNGDHPSLCRLTSSAGQKIVVDIGVWKGQSTISMANAMKASGIDGVVLAIDTFLGSPEHWGSNLFQRKNGLPDLYQVFMANVFQCGLTDYVIPFPQTSSTAAQILKSIGISPTVVHVDAAHEYREVLRDAEDYWGLLQVGGYLIGDDYHLSWPGVVQAAGEFSARVGRPLTIEGPKWILQK